MSALEERWAVVRCEAQRSHQGLVLGDKYALVPLTWWHAWVAYVGGFSQESDVEPAVSILSTKGTLDLPVDDPDVQSWWPPARTTTGTFNVASKAPPPGPIDMVELIDIADSTVVAKAKIRQLECTTGRSGAQLTHVSRVADASAEAPTAGFLASLGFASPLLRRGLVQGAHFKVIGATAFSLLSNRYGLKGPALLRRVVHSDDFFLNDSGTVDDSSSIGWQSNDEFRRGDGRSSARGSHLQIELFPPEQRRLWKLRDDGHPVSSFTLDSTPFKSSCSDSVAASVDSRAGRGAGSAPSSSPASPMLNVHGVEPHQSPVLPSALSDESPPPPAVRACSTCGRRALFMCTRCSKVYYCEKGCQRIHWRASHQRECNISAANIDTSLRSSEDVFVEKSALTATTMSSQPFQDVDVEARALQPQALRPLHPAPTHNGVVGLTNLGNTCFMAASIQALSVAWPLTQHMLSDSWRREVNKHNRDGTGGALARAYSDLLRKMWFAPRGTVAVDPTDVKRAIVRFQERFTGVAQQDAGELMQFLLDGLNEDLNRIAEKPYTAEEDEYGARTDVDVAATAWKRYLSRNLSIVTTLFAGQFKSRVVCPRCMRPSLRFDPYTAIVLPIPSAHDVASSMNRHFFVRVGRTPLDCASRASNGATTIRSLLAQELAALNATAPPRKVAARGTTAPTGSCSSGSVDVSTKGSGIATVLASEANFNGPRWQMVAVSVRRTEYVSSLRRAVAAAAAAPAADILLLWAPIPSRPTDNVPATARPHFQLLHDQDLLDASIPRGQSEPTLGVVAFVLPHTDAAAVAPAADSTSRSRATSRSVLPRGNDNVRSGDMGVDGSIVLYLHHLVPPRRDEADPPEPVESFEAMQLARSSIYHSQPTVIVLPRGATVAELRLAAARGVSPILKGGLAAVGTALQQHSSSGAPTTKSLAPGAVSDEGALAMLAAALPILSMSFVDRDDDDGSDGDVSYDGGRAGENGFNCVWVPPFPTQSEPDVMLSDVLFWDTSSHCSDTGRYANVAHLAVPWRTQWRPLFDMERAARNAAGGGAVSPTIAAVQAAVASERESVARILQEGVPLASCFQRFSEPEILDQENAFYCSKCAAHVCATKTMEIWASPRLLVLVLKRFRGRGGKIEARVNFPLTGLDLTSIAAGGRSLAVTEEAPADALASHAAAADAAVSSLQPRGQPTLPLLYDCFAVVNHYGSMAFGHYTAYVNHMVGRYGVNLKTNDHGRWFECDDRRVSPVTDEAEVVSADAYILLYRRRD